MFARQRRSRQRQRHPVLKLVAETISAARLIKRRSRPYAADQRLVEQPAIEHDVHRPVGCGHLDGAEHVVPMLHDIAKDRVQIGRAVARDQGLRVCRGGGFAEEENDLDRFVRPQSQRGPENTAGIEPRAHPLGKQALPPQAPPGCRACRFARGTRAGRRSSSSAVRPGRQRLPASRTPRSRDCAQGERPFWARSRHDERR